VPAQREVVAEVPEETPIASPRRISDGPLRNVRPRRRWPRELARYTVLVGASIAGIFPVLWIVSVAMKTQGEYTLEPMGLPEALSFSNFSAVLGDADFLKYLLNSLVVVGVAVPVVTITSVMAGYALARQWGRAGNGILFLFLFSELIPLPIVAIPLLLTVKELGLEDGTIRLIFVYTVLMMGFAVIVSRAFFRSIPEELREAARLDGCGELQVFWRIMVPLARSPIALIAVLAFIFLWNELFLAAVLLDSANDRTLPLGLTEFRGRYTTDWPKVAAALILSSVPTVFLFSIFQGRIASQFSRSTVRA
jgi:ABC-type glycerol-3-phosphate transport system permease component